MRDLDVGGLMHGDYVLPDGTVRCYRRGYLVRRGWVYRTWVRVKSWWTGRREP